MKNYYAEEHWQYNAIKNEGFPLTYEHHDNKIRNWHRSLADISDQDDGENPKEQRINWS